MIADDPVRLCAAVGPNNALTDVAGLQVGQKQDFDQKTGVSIVVCDKPMIAGISTLGGAPGTRDTDLLRQGNSVDRVDGIVLSGGSAFGLDANGGAMAALAELGRGFEAAGNRVPIVPGAILFDLASGGMPHKGAFRPHRELAYEAVKSASKHVEQGSVGAGTGANAGWLKGGVGTASAVMENGLVVSALIAVNSLGQTTMGDTQHFWAAPFEECDEFGGMGLPNPLPANAKEMRMKYRHQSGTRQNTTIGVVATNATLTPSQCERMAMSGQDGLARAIWPCHTPGDGDCIFALASEESSHALTDIEFFDLCALTAAVSARAVAKAIYLANGLPNDPYPSWNDKFGA